MNILGNKKKLEPSTNEYNVTTENISLKLAGFIGSDFARPNMNPPGYAL